jgi:hypothetical protein
MNGDQGELDFDGLYSSDGATRYKLVIQTPGDMLPPVTDAQTDAYGRVYRGRQRF